MMPVLRCQWRLCLHPYDRQVVKTLRKAGYPEACMRPIGCTDKDPSTALTVLVNLDAVIEYATPAVLTLAKRLAGQDVS